MKNGDFNHRFLYDQAGYPQLSMDGFSHGKWISSQLQGEALQLVGSEKPQFWRSVLQRPTCFHMENHQMSGNLAGGLSFMYRLVI
jgi:hypothetical protein